MPLLKPIIGGRPDVLTPEEQQRAVRPEVYDLGRTIELMESPDRYQRVNLDLAIMGGERALREARALDQGGFELAGKALGNFATTVVTEVMKMPGYLGGPSNLYLDGIKQLREVTGDQWFEVFTPPSVEEGDLITQLSNPYFWAKEGADGVGFLASFLLPGQLLKAVGVGEKAVQGLSKLGKLESAIVDATQFSEAPNMLGRLLLKGAGKTGRGLDFGRMAANIESGTAVLTNTLLEASAEASEGYDQAIQSGKSEEEAGDIASRIFKWNMGILGISNAIVEKYLMNGFNRLTSVKPLSTVTDEIIAGTKDLSFSVWKQGLKKAATRIPAGAAQEGFFEEGLQTVVGQTEGGSIGEVLEKYAQNFNGMFGDDPDAIDFGKATILGSLLGQPTAIGGAVQEARADRDYLMGTPGRQPGFFGRLINRKATEAQEGVIPSLRAAHKAITQDITSVLQMDVQGNVVDFAQGGKEMLKEAAGLNILNNYYRDLVYKYGGDTSSADNEFIDSLQKASNKQQAIVLNKMVKGVGGISNPESIKYIQHEQDLEYFSKFLRLEGGDELLKDHIDAMVDASAVRFEQNTGVKLSDSRKTTLRNELTTKAEELKKVYDTVESTHNPYILGTEVEPEDTAKYNLFFHASKSARIKALADYHHFDERIRDLEAQINDPNVSDSRKAILEKDRDVYTQAKEMVDKEYQKLSTRNGLKQEWEKFKGIIEPVVEPETPAEQASTPPPIQPQEAPYTRDQFWQEVRDAGYEVEEGPDGFMDIKDDDDIVIRGSNNIEYGITAQGDKIKLYATEDPTQFQIFDNLSNIYRRLKGFRVVSKQEAEQSRQQRKERLIQAKLGVKRQAMMLALNEMNKELDQLLEANRKEVEGIEKQISDLTAEAKVVRKEGDPKTAKELLKNINSSKRKLRRTLASLEQERIVLEEKRNLVGEYINELGKGTEVRDLVNQNKEKYKDLLTDLEESDRLAGTIEEIEREIAANTLLIGSIQDQISFLEDVELALQSILNQHDALQTIGISNYTEQLKDYLANFNYTDRLGKLRELPFTEDTWKAIRSGDNRKIKPLIDHIQRYASQENLNPDDVWSDIRSRLLEMGMVSQYDTPQALENILLATTSQRKALEAQLEPLTKKDTFLNLARAIKLHNDMMASLNKRFKEIRRNIENKTIAQDGSQLIPDKDGGENVFDPQGNQDVFYEHALPDELFGSTGQNVLTDSKGEDLYTTREGIEIPRLTDNLYQQQFFRWMDSLKTLKGVKAEARTVYYDERDGDLLPHFLRANEQNRRSGQDVAVVITDKDGNVIYGADKLPLFSWVRRPETKFPVNKPPKMNIPALLNTFVDEVLGVKVGVDRADLQSDARMGSQDKTLNAIMKVVSETYGQSLDDLHKMTRKEFFTELTDNAISWGRDRYEAIIQSINNAPDGKIQLKLRGITKGFPVQLRENGEPKTFNPIESLGLEFTASGKPKNFSIHKADANGNIQEGRKSLSGFFKGLVYIKLNTGQYVPLIPRTLQDSEIDVVLHGLALLGTTGTLNAPVREGYPEVTMKVGDRTVDKNNPINVLPNKDSRLSLLTMILNWGKPKDRITQYDITIGNGLVYYEGGMKSVSLFAIKNAVDSDTNEGIQDFLNFLKTKKINVDYSLLEESTTSKTMNYIHPVVKDGKIVFEHKTEGYLPYILAQHTTTIPPKEVLEQYGLPAFVQRNLQFEDPLSTAGKPKPKKQAEKTAQPAQTSTPTPTPKKEAKKSAPPPQAKEDPVVSAQQRRIKAAETKKKVRETSEELKAIDDRLNTYVQSLGSLMQGVVPEGFEQMTSSIEQDINKLEEQLQLTEQDFEEYTKNNTPSALRAVYSDEGHLRNHMRYMYTVNVLYPKLVEQPAETVEKVEEPKVRKEEKIEKSEPGVKPVEGKVGARRGLDRLGSTRKPEKKQEDEADDIMKRALSSAEMLDYFLNTNQIQRTNCK